MLLRLCLSCLVGLILPVVAAATTVPLAERIAALSRQNGGQSGAWVLEKGEEALMARAWLGQEAAETIDIQYFIWSSDNIGTLAAEALLTAAERGVRVRVLVDDLLVDAPDDSLIALAQHHNIKIRIYNPLHKVGVSLPERLFNLATDFHSANQRMHDKSFVVDGAAAIVGGRNMADEYFDYDHAYNFRDRDLLLLGPGVAPISASFERFWNSPEARDVLTLLAAHRLTDSQCDAVYRALHAYAAAPDNFAPQVRQALTEIPASIDRLVPQLTWCSPCFLHDLPGKPATAPEEMPGITPALYAALHQAQTEILIQSPYLVLSDLAFDLLRAKIAQGVRVRINTNSLLATDNLPAYSGYAKQRRKLLAAGFDLREFRPDAAVRQQLRDGFAADRQGPTTFAIHAKTLVIDRRQLYIGTFNLDPRSMHLNTEIAVHIDHPGLAGQVADAIAIDMAPGNSWDPRSDNSHAQASWLNRAKLRLLRLIPMDSIL